MAFKYTIVKQKAEKECRKKCDKEKTRQTHTQSDGVVLLFFTYKNFRLIPSYLFGHLVRSCITKKRVHEACCAKLLQLQRNTALVAQVVMNHFFVKCQGDSLKKCRQ